MVIEAKMSGWSITHWDGISLVEYIKSKKKDVISTWNIVYLAEVCELCPKRVFDTILKHYHIQETSYGLATLLDMDDNEKLGIMCAFPATENELIKAFGTNWFDYYLRFGH